MDNIASEICNYVRKAAGIQEQLKKSLKSGSDTRPWTGPHSRHLALADSYASLVPPLIEKCKETLLSGFNRELNKDLSQFLGFTKFFEELQSATNSAIHLVAPGYYVMTQFCAISQSDSSAILQLKTNVEKAIDEKYFPSISGLHWLASCLDPSF